MECVDLNVLGVGHLQAIMLQDDDNLNNYNDYNAILTSWFNMGDFGGPMVSDSGVVVCINGNSITVQLYLSHSSSAAYYRIKWGSASWGEWKSI